MRKPLSTAQFDSESYLYMIDKTFAMLKCGTTDQNIATLAPVASESAGSGAGRPGGRIDRHLGRKLLSLEKENSSDFKRQNANGKTLNDAQAVDENDLTHAKMMVFEPLLEVSGERNLRSINLAHKECPCHCLA